jgi:PAS domain S-box-containing protein
LRESNERLAREIAEHKRSEARFRRLSESNMIGIIFANLRGEIRKANDAFLRMLGYTRKDLNTGKLKWTDLTPPEYQRIRADAIREIKALGACRPYEQEFIREDGSRIPVLMGAALLEGSNDETVTFIIDMTERNQAQEERSRLLIAEQKARAEAERALRYREDFISIAAHELRTPLTPLRLRIQLVEKGLKKIQLGDLSNLGQISQNTATIRKDLERFTHLINSLLDIATVNAGKLLTLKLARCSLNSVVESALERIQLQLEGTGIKVFTDLEPDVSGNWDCLKLEQAITNLVTNAMKYSNGTQIDIKLKTQNNTVCLNIQDNGIGIPEDRFSNLFSPFERAGPEKETEGLGLGLFITSEIIRAHEGKISVSSEAGKGTSFTIELPFSQARTMTIAA